MMSLSRPGAYMRFRSADQTKKAANESSEATSGALRESRANKVIDFDVSI